MTRYSIDFSELTPETLRSADQDLFMRIVDADLKRNSKRNFQPVPEWVTTALRTEHLDRWHATLDRMLVQVEGRLTVLQAEWAAKELRLIGAERDEQLRAYRDACLRSERFRSGVRDAMAEADILYDGRVAELEQAIRDHRAEIESNDSVDPSNSDVRLWATVEH